MTRDDLLKHFFGGFVRLHLLYHAAKEPICGIEMIAELKRHGYKLSPGTLYPILHHLESGGYLSSSEQIVAGKRRKNYRITAQGRKLMRKGKAKLRELFSEVIAGRDRLAETRKQDKP